MSPSDQSIVKRSKASLVSPQVLIPVYWRQLVEQGVSAKAARVIAQAIANYDATSRPPTLQQQRLICRYSRFICRAGLWRSRLLLMSSSDF